MIQLRQQKVANSYSQVVHKTGKRLRQPREVVSRHPVQLLAPELGVVLRAAGRASVGGEFPNGQGLVGVLASKL
jgi:hypothetical protein